MKEEIKKIIQFAKVCIVEEGQVYSFFSPHVVFSHKEIEALNSIDEFMELFQVRYNNLLISTLNKMKELSIVGEG